MSRAIRDPRELLQVLELDRCLGPAHTAAGCFPLRVPRGFVARMGRRNPHDPLLRQVLPLEDELHTAPGYVSDPVGDRTAIRAPGLLHKYHGRALLIATQACAVHCRYCFRRHFPYRDNHAAGNGWRTAMEYVASQPTIQEVILSGGDPLVLNDERLQNLVARLANIQHLKRLRIHSRLPVVIPERITNALLRSLTRTRLRTAVVIHINHPQEIDPKVHSALSRMRSSGIPVLNQAVLLRGVNDEVDTLMGLSTALFEAGVLPYYLHLLDKVQGAAHFAVEDTIALHLHRQLSAKLPGYLVPRLVRDAPGTSAKLPLEPQGLLPSEVSYASSSTQETDVRPSPLPFVRGTPPPKTQ
jgi:EF-P beta-lysylation protein EpmB